MLPHPPWLVWWSSGYSKNPDCVRLLLRALLGTVFYVHAFGSVPKVCRLAVHCRHTWQFGAARRSLRHLSNVDTQHMYFLVQVCACQIITRPIPQRRAVLRCCRSASVGAREDAQTLGVCWTRSSSQRQTRGTRRGFLRISRSAYLTLGGESSMSDSISTLRRRRLCLECVHGVPWGTAKWC